MLGLSRLSVNSVSTIRQFVDRVPCHSAPASRAVETIRVCRSRLYVRTARPKRSSGPRATRPPGSARRPRRDRLPYVLVRRGALGIDPQLQGTRRSCPVRFDSHSTPRISRRPWSRPSPASKPKLDTCSYPTRATVPKDRPGQLRSHVTSNRVRISSMKSDVLATPSSRRTRR